MLRNAFILSAGLLIFGFSQSAVAQVTNLALSQAKSRLACGTGAVVGSVFLPNGSLEVTCARPPKPGEAATTTTTATSVVQTTGLVAPTGIGVIGSVGILAAISGGGNSDTTTATAPSDR